MRCSMMFKRGLLPLLLLALLCGLLVCAGAEEAEEVFLPDGSGEILLVHSRLLEETEQKSIEKLVTICAAMGKIVDYGTPEQCAQVLGEYDYVICYRLSGTTPAFDAALKGASSKLLFLGGETMAHYLRLTGGEVPPEEPQKNGRLCYTFPTGKQCEGIVRWEQLYRLPSDGYESGVLQAGGESYPFCVQSAGARFIPVYDLTQTIVLGAVTEEIVQWMWPYNDKPRDYAQFLVLDSVYPFMDPQQLLDIVEAAEELSVPYVISVMPLTANGHYPAMTQFCQVLAYAQSKGASILLHAPILHKTVEDVNELYERLTDMTMAYVQNGVYPVGIQVPLSWINQEPYLTLLKRYRTVFLYDDGAESGFDLQTHTSLIARQGHQLVYPILDLDQSGISQLECFPSAAYADWGSQKDVFLEYAKNGKTAGKPYLDLRDYNHSVWLNNCYYTWRNRSVYLDGTLVDLTFRPVAYDTEFDYQRSPLVRMTVDLKNQNRVLMVIVVILTVFFLSGIVFARHRMRKRFFSDSGKERE